MHLYVWRVDSVHSVHCSSAMLNILTLPVKTDFSMSIVECIYYSHQRGYVLEVPVCFLVCWLVGWFVSRTAQILHYKFPWNLDGGPWPRIDPIILMLIWIKGQIQDFFFLTFFTIVSQGSFFGVVLFVCFYISINFSGNNAWMLKF